MNSVIWNFLEINLSLIAFILVYLIIRGRLSFQQRRFALLSTPLLAMSVVGIRTYFTGYSYQLGWIELEPIVVGTNPVVAEQQSFSMSIELIYALGFSFALLVFLVKLGRLLFFFYTTKGYNQDGYIISHAEGKSSFSFFKWIQISAHLKPEEQKIVFEHEALHAKMKHSVDLLLAEVFQIVFWFNPIFLWMKKELIAVHEYEVDTAMYQKYKVNYMQFLLSYALGADVSHFQLGHRFFNEITLKKRIKIMKTQVKKSGYLLMALPLIAMVLFFVQCTKDKQSDDAGADSEIETPILDFAEVEPEYPGGQTEMAMFIGEHVNYPEEAIEEGIEGTVYVQFVVDNKGEIKDIEVRKGVHPLLDKEAKRVVAKMPKWKPGMNEGSAVSVRYMLPILFRLS